MYESINSGVGSVGGNPKSAQEATSSHVSQEMSVIHSLLGEHGDVCGYLEMRLNAIMRPNTSPGVEGGKQSIDRPVASPMCSDLHAFSAQLTTLLSRYREILDRLEV